MSVGTRDRAAGDRLSALDASNLRVEDRGMPMHVAALVVLGPAAEGASSPRPMTLELLRATIGQRLHRVPRLRQVLSPPRRRWGAPVWADDQLFDISQHVQERCVPPPGGEAQLLSTCADLNEARLDRTLPLWQIWLLTGLPEGRTALLVRLHHAVADGVAAVSMLGALLDDQSTADQRTGPRFPASHALPPRATVRARLAAVSRQARQVARDGRAPRLSFNVPVAGRRRILVVRADLARARSVAHAYGGTVNDVLLAAVAGGTRCLLQARNELTPGLEVKASIAASLRPPGEQPAAGNQVGVLVVPLRIDIADPQRQLARIAATTAERKRLPPYRVGAGFMLRWMTCLMRRQRLVNLLVSNLPGPAQPLFFASSPVLELAQIGVIQGNMPLSVGAISYAGQLTVDIVADCNAVPDLDTFAAGLRDVLRDLDVLRAA